MTESVGNFQTVLAVIEEMDRRFSSEDKWTKSTYARRADGAQCGELHPEAFCHCLVGQAIAVAPDRLYSGYTAVLNSVGNEAVSFLLALAKTLPLSKEKASWSINLSDWNDAPSTTFQDVKDLLKLAKEKLATNNSVSQ